jgi:1-acyl-sn-glycerol-3-phosphate acyltransferase
MIKANPTRWAKFIFHIYVMRLMKRHFHAFHLFGDLPQPDPNLPLLLVPNHSNWWDGFFVYLLNDQILKRNLYLMMLDRQLAKYKFFARIGAFGITPGDKENVQESLNYSFELLQLKNVMITMFPQGVLLPWGKRPLNFKKGIESIIQLYKKPINILPLAIRSEYGGEQRANAFFQFGENFVVDAQSFQGVKWLEEVELKLLNDLAEKIVDGDHGIKLLAGRGSVNVKMDKLFGRE